MPCELWAPLRLTLWYVGSQLMEDVGSPLLLLVVTKCIVSVAVYLVSKAHDTCRRWYRFLQALRALRTLPLEEVLGAVGRQNPQLYQARIERFNSSEVSLSHSSSSSQCSSIYDGSSGRTGDTGDFL